MAVGVATWVLQGFCETTTEQGRNEVFFFIADPVFLPQFLIPDSKSDENFDPWSRKILLIPGDILFIAPMRHYSLK